MREREEKEAAERRAREKEEEERRAREEEEEAAAEVEVVPLLPREEIFRRLRRLNQPVILFGETDHQVRVACRVACCVRRKVVAYACRVCVSCVVRWRASAEAAPVAAARVGDAGRSGVQGRRLERSVRFRSQEHGQGRRLRSTSPPPQPIRGL